ncbi:MAG TPA: hypothetical protein VHK27_05025 [Gammaproteobacteria bacterium]|nr:hypothetical protein [Gammaproteobacteria bacterium]
MADTTQTDMSVLAAIAQEVYELKKKVAALESQIRGHKSHLMDVIAPDGNTCEGPIVVRFDDRTVRVSHKHTIDADKMAQRYPYSKRPELWEHTPNTAMVRASITDDKVMAMSKCSDSFIVVS